LGGGGEDGAEGVGRVFVSGIGREGGVEGRVGGVEGGFAICSYLFGLGGLAETGALATGFCDRSTITLALGGRVAVTGFDGGAFAIGVTSLVWVAVEYPAQPRGAVAILEHGRQLLCAEATA
tara:strand:+ start:486 stop:851 length:366 start_codon:yes stop_codon:yes gene_type:complete